MKYRKYSIILFIISLISILIMNNIHLISQKQNTSELITKLVDNSENIKTVSVTFKNTGYSTLDIYKGHDQTNERIGSVNSYQEQVFQLEIGTEYTYVYDQCSIITEHFIPTEQDEGRIIEVNTFMCSSVMEFDFKLNINKVWSGDEQNITKRPNSVNIKATCYITTTSYSREYKDYFVTLNNENNWSSNLTIYSVENPTCTINEETQLDDYEVSYSPKSITLQTNIYTYNSTVTNTYKGPKVANIKIKKEWVDESEEYRPEEVIVNVECPSKTEEIKLTKANNWEATYSIESTEEETCKLTEKNTVSNYKRIDENTTFKAQDGNEVIIKNEIIKPEDTSIEAIKKWVDDDNKNHTRPNSIKVILKANGKEIDSIELNESNSWKYTFTVPKTDYYGNVIEYTIDEENTPNGYDKEIEGFTIINTLKPILNPNTTILPNPATPPNTNDKIGIFFIILIALSVLIIYLKKKKIKSI